MEPKSLLELTLEVVGLKSQLDKITQSYDMARSALLAHHEFKPAVERKELKELLTVSKEVPRSPAIPREVWSEWQLGGDELLESLLHSVKTLDLSYLDPDDPALNRLFGALANDDRRVKVSPERYDKEELADIEAQYNFAGRTFPMDVLERVYEGQVPDDYKPTKEPTYRISLSAMVKKHNEESQ